MFDMFDETFVDPFFDRVHHPDSSTLQLEFKCPRKWKTVYYTVIPVFEERFVTHSGKDEPVKSFYDPVTRNKVKTMSNPNWCKTKGIPMNGEEMYLRLLAINSYKKVPLERVLAYEMQPYL